MNRMLDLFSIKFDNNNNNNNNNSQYENEKEGVSDDVKRPKHK